MIVYTTQGGNVRNLSHIAQKDICLKDIAHSLSFQCRFNGHTERFYSVAEHSIILRDLVRAESGIQNLDRRMAALLHDAAECYLGDIANPVKNRLCISEIHEETILEEVFSTFGVPYSAFDEELKAMDKDLCIVEGYFLIGGMYWSKVYYDLVKRSPIFVKRAKDILAEHDGSIWESPSRIAHCFEILLKEEWENFSTISEPLEEPNAEPAE